MTKIWYVPKPVHLSSKFEAGGTGLVYEALVLQRHHQLLLCVLQSSFLQLRFCVDLLIFV